MNTILVVDEDNFCQYYGLGIYKGKCLLSHNFAVKFNKGTNGAQVEANISTGCISFNIENVTEDEFKKNGPQIINKMIDKITNSEEQLLN